MKITIEKGTALIVSVLMGIVGLWYSYLIFLGSIKPVLATWFFFGLATALGFKTYLSEKSMKRSWVTNIANTTDVVATWLIFLSLIFLGKNIRYGFNGFEIFCISCVAVTFIFWLTTRDSQKANVAINIIITIAYLPTIYGLWLATEVTEPLAVWLTVFVAQVVALYNPIKKKDGLALLYAGRATILVGTVVVLITRFYI